MITQTNKSIVKVQMKRNGRLMELAIPAAWGKHVPEDMRVGKAPKIRFSKTEFEIYRPLADYIIRQRNHYFSSEWLEANCWNGKRLQCPEFAE